MAARDLLNRFHAKIRIRKPELPDGRIAPAHERGLASFASEIAADYAAVAPPPSAAHGVGGSWQASVVAQA